MARKDKFKQVNTINCLVGKITAGEISMKIIKCRLSQTEDAFNKKQQIYYIK